MANPDFDTIVATTMKHYEKRLEDNVFSCRPFMFWLMRGDRIRRGNCGTSIVCPLIYAENSTCGSYRAYDTLPTTPQKGISAAEFCWKQYACSVSLCGYEEAINRGECEVIDLVDAKVMQAEETIIEHLDQMFIQSDGSGNNGKDFCGLAGLIGNACISPEAGGIDASDPSCDFWQSVIDDNGAAEAIKNGEDAPDPIGLTLKDMAHVFNCASCGSDHPDLILTSKELYEGYECLLQPNQMFTNTTVADAGFQNLTYKGVTIMWDDYVPEDTMYFLNSKYIKLYTMADRWFNTTPFIRPANQDARYSQILLMGELTICNRRRQGALCNRKPMC